MNSKSRRDLKMNFNRTFSNVTLDATAHLTVKHFKSRLHKTVEMFLCGTSWCLQSIIAPLKRPTLQALFTKISVRQDGGNTKQRHNPSEYLV